MLRNASRVQIAKLIAQTFQLRIRNESSAETSFWLGTSAGPAGADTPIGALPSAGLFNIALLAVVIVYQISRASMRPGFCDLPSKRDGLHFRVTKHTEYLLMRLNVDERPSRSTQAEPETTDYADP